MDYAEMSAGDYVSADQFGFTTPAQYVGSDVDDDNWRTKRVRIDRPLRAGQPKVSPKIVDEYAAARSNRDSTGHLPQVVKRKGEHVVFEGHHRIAAARKRGQKSMTVDYQEVQ
jgi:hypothetical protein